MGRAPYGSQIFAPGAAITWAQRLNLADEIESSAYWAAAGEKGSGGVRLAKMVGQLVRFLREGPPKPREDG